MADARPAAPSSRADLRTLAEAHTLAILGFVVGAPLALVVASLAGDGEPSTLALVGRVASALVMSAALFVLARALHEPGPVIWAVAPVVHFMLGLVVFAFLNVKARRRLGAAGVTVGVFGARRADLPSPEGDPPALG